MSQPIAITGANGNLGVRLIETLGIGQVRALVRSSSARDALLKRFAELDVRVVRYTDQDSLALGLADCSAVVHLVGILKQSRTSTYFDAHERSCETLVSALPDSVKRIVYISILGSSPESENACLFSKGRAEEILKAGAVGVTVLQVPMVMGEGDYASAALRKNATKSRVTVFRGESLEQPIYAGDVISAIQSSLELSGKQSFQLAGPESLPRSELIQRAADLRGNTVSVRSLPMGLGFLLAWILEWLPNPPVTRAMLGVLDHDDSVQPEAAAAALGITLTPLDDMLRLTTYQ